MKKLGKIMTILIVVIAVSATLIACLSQSAWADSFLTPANEEATYNVTLNGNGGMVKLTESDAESETLPINTSLIATRPIATKAPTTDEQGNRTTWICTGWYTNPQGTGDMIVFPYTPTGAVTLYAVYSADTTAVVKIDTAQKLFDVRYSLKKNYILTKDIDLGGAVWRPIGYTDITDAEGKQKRYDNPFEGIFNGNGFKITNFKLVVNADTQGLDANFLCKGLFAILDNGAQVKNLTVSDFRIDIEGNVSRFYVGGIAGKLINGSITNCKVKGTVYNPKSEYEEGIWDDFFGSYDTPTSNTYIGGIVGLVGASGASANEDEDPTVEQPLCYVTNCSAEGTFQSESVATNVYVGGLIGYNRTAIVSKSYTFATVKGRYAGGLMAYNDRTVTNCFSVGSVSGSLAYPAIGGGLIAYNDINGSVSKCYSSGTVTARTAGGLIGVNMFSYLVASNGITNCYSASDVVAAEYGGGLLGRTEAVIPINGIIDYANGIYVRQNGIHTNLYYINHCMSFGDVSVTVKDVYYTSNEANQIGTNGVYHSVFAGGLIGHASESILASCLAFGDVEAKSERPISDSDNYVYNAVYANNLIGHSTNQYIGGSGTNAQKSAYRSVYAIEGQAVIRNVEENYRDFNTVPSISYNNANSMTYLTNAEGMGFDATIWNLSSLDIANGIYPTLR